MQGHRIIVFRRNCCRNRRLYINSSFIWYEARVFLGKLILFSITAYLSENVLARLLSFSRYYSSERLRQFLAFICFVFWYFLVKYVFWSIGWNMITPRFPPLYRFQSFIVISRGFSKNTQIRDCSAAHSPTRGRTIREKTDLVLFSFLVLSWKHFPIGYNCRGLELFGIFNTFIVLTN